MKISNRILLSLICLIVALVFPMLQIQAADQVVNDKSDSLEFHCTWYLHFKEQDKIYTYGDVSRVVYGRDLRKYSLAYIDSLSGNYRFLIFVTSPAPIEYSGSTSDNKRVEVNGNVVYYLFIDAIESGLDLDNQSLTWSGIPNLTMYSETKDLNSIATGIAEDMARVGYYNYDDSEWATDRPSYDSNKLQFSSSLGYLQGVQYKNVTPTDVFPYQIYSQISWDNSNDDFKDAYVQFAADMTYKVGARIYSESMSIFNSYSIPYSDGKYTFLMSDVLNGSVVGSNATIKKVDFYYVRLVKYDRENSVFLYGGWTRIDTNKFTVDTIAFDEEKQDYYIDSDSDSSYSDQMGIDGNYGTTTWGDLSSASADSFKWFFSMLKDLFGMMGSFPSMLKTVFSFLPSAYINCLSLLLMACIIMRILGR